MNRITKTQLVNAFKDGLQFRDGMFFPDRVPAEVIAKIEASKWGLHRVRRDAVRACCKERLVNG